MNKLIILLLFFISILPTAFLSETFAGEKDIVALSNFIQDRFHKTNSNFVQNNELVEGNTILINKQQEDELNTAIENAQSSGSLEHLKQNPGGAAANTIFGLKTLGFNDVGLIGTVADDQSGNDYKAGLDQKGIDYRITAPQNPNNGTGTCYVFVTEKEKKRDDGTISTEIERTMATSLGVAAEINVAEDDIEWACFAKCFLADGYLFRDSSPDYISTLAVAAEMKKREKQIVLTIAAEYCANAYKREINNFIQQYANIILGNNKEVLALTDSPGEISAIQTLQAMGKKGAVTCGADGAYVFDQDHIYFISSPAIEKESIIDTTGAGDQFAAGFLHEFLQSADIMRAGQLGAFCAGQVIQVLGGHPPETLEADVKSGEPWEISYREILVA